jgi:glycyl-radical enzyme activating protein
MRIFATGWSDEFDGPGRRWIVYLQGCSFRCRWCANPEGLETAPVMQFFPDRGAATESACPFGAVSGNGSGLRLDRSKCSTCATRPCIRVWRHPAFAIAGEDVSVEEIVRRAVSSRALMEPDGGVTFGGGEPTLQMNELLAALDALRGEGIHTTVETNAEHVELSRLFGKTDLLIADLKAVSRDRHVAWTGTDNDRVLENLRLAAKEQAALLIRIPLVTGLNDEKQEQVRMAEFLAEVAATRERLDVQILRLHHLGEPKYAALGLEYPMRGTPVPSLENANAFAAMLVAKGMRAAVAN